MVQLFRSLLCVFVKLRRRKYSPHGVLPRRDSHFCSPAFVALNRKESQPQACGYGRKDQEKIRKGKEAQEEEVNELACEINKNLKG